MNTILDFGKEMENVERRIAVYETQTLPRTTAGVDKWIHEHAMDCLVWTANGITANIDTLAAVQRDLGVLITGDFKWSKQVNAVCTKAPTECWDS
jgi:hypothetical protein